MRAALTVARELLWCRLMDNCRDALRERVAELLDAAATGAPPFCYQLTPQAAVGSHGRPRHARVLPSAPGGLVGINAIPGGGRPVMPAPPPDGCGHERCRTRPHRSVALPSSGRCDGSGDMERGALRRGLRGSDLGGLRAPHDGPGVHTGGRLRLVLGTRMIGGGVRSLGLPGAAREPHQPRRRQQIHGTTNPSGASLR